MSLLRNVLIKFNELKLISSLLIKKFRQNSFNCCK